MDFIGYVKMKQNKELLENMGKISEGSLGFRGNHKDHEEWNDI